MEERNDLFGRSVIYTDVEEITRDNVVKVLKKAMETHTQNSTDIDYLYDVYRGKQGILQRTKEVRPEINNKVTVNRANQITTFKVGYSFADPILYVCRKGYEGASENINLLNEYMYTEDKAEKDIALATWFFVAGVGNRMILPKKDRVDGDAPFDIYVLDPRYSFVVKHTGLGNKTVMGVKYITREDRKILYSVYTKNKYFEILDDKIVKEEDHWLGRVPIIEYVANHARLGAFEVVLPLLDAINRVMSDRLNGVEQFIQALLVLQGVDIDSEEFKLLREEGGLKIPAEGAVEYLTSELNQTQTQTLMDDLYETVLTICGMPNRNGGSSTSDTGTATIVRDGWSDAESRAKEVDRLFKHAEKDFLRLAIDITNTIDDIDIKLASVDIKPSRRNYENIQMKAQVLVTLLNQSKVHPRYAFEYCNMFSDPELAFTESMEYYKQYEEEQLRKLEEETPIEEEKHEEEVEEDV